MLRNTGRIAAGLLAGAAAQVTMHAAISLAGAHPFPVIGAAWLHLAAFLVGGYAGGRAARRAWPTALPALCAAAGLILVDYAIDPGVSVSTLTLAGLGMWGNIWAARRAARAASRAAASSSAPPLQRSPQPPP